MLRHLLVFIAALALAVPGVVSVVTNVSSAPASPPASSLPSPAAVPAALPTIVPTVTPSPGDTTPPVTTATGMGSRWRNDPATVEFTAVDTGSGVAATVFRVDDGDWVVGTSVVIKAPKDHSNDGEHVIIFYSVDNALNQETPQTVTVKIDTRPPHFAWRSLSPSLIRSIRSIHLGFTIDERSGPVRLSYEVTDQYGYLAAKKSGLERTAGARSVDLVPRYRNHKGFVPGVYRVQFTVIDEAGNSTVSKRRSFRNHRPVNGGVWHRVNGAGKRVALTFDDGGAGPWQSMLNTFKRYGMHGTFFPLGAYAAASPGLMRRTVHEGHGIGVHGWSHTAMTRQSASQVQSEWLRNAAPWWSATGYSPVPYCRPPYGDMNRSTTAASSAIGFYRVILWDVDPRDWASPGSGAIASRVLSHVRPGSIVCMHLTSQTAAALPSILSGLKARGYTAVSLPELFHAAGMR
jgi:peptidoglycan/xylan/chitin deacetylase (PgdA/CDA1 family)